MAQLVTWWPGWLGLVVGVTTLFLQSRITDAWETSPGIAAGMLVPPLGVFGEHELWVGSRPVATTNATTRLAGDHLGPEASPSADDASSTSPTAAELRIDSSTERPLPQSWLPAESPTSVRLQPDDRRATIARLLAVDLSGSAERVEAGVLELVRRWGWLEWPARIRPASPSEAQRWDRWWSLGVPDGGASRQPGVGASDPRGHRPTRTSSGPHRGRTERGEPPRRVSGQPKLVRPDASPADAPRTRRSPATDSIVCGTRARQPHRRLPGRGGWLWLGKPPGRCRTASAPAGGRS
jgi:hypothetical protein